MKLMVLCMSTLLLWIFCLQQCYCLTTVTPAAANERGMFQTCNRTEECSGDNVECDDDSKTCSCIEQYYHDNGVCIKWRYLGDNCTKDDCTVLNSTCSNNICDCLPGFYQNENKTMCLARRYLGDNCTKDDCTVLNSTCSNNICDCLPGFYQNENQTMCLARRYLGDNCTKDDCTVLNSTCSNNICDCLPGFYQNENKTMCLARRYLGDNCTKDDCTVLNSTCSNNICDCLPGFYQNENKTMCLAQKEVNQYCKNTEECLGDNVVCDDSKKCSCIDAFYHKDDICKKRHDFDEYCDGSEECRNVDNIECRNHRCKCASQHYRMEGKCNRKLGPGSKCKSQEMCSALSECKKLKCVCTEDHYLHQSICYLKLGHGQVCNNGGCKGDYMECNHRCVCADGFEYNGQRCKRKSSNALLIVVILLILLLLGLLVFVLWKIKKQKSDLSKPPRRLIQLEPCIPHCRPIVMSKFPETVASMTQDSNKIFSEQFSDLGRINPRILNENSDIRSPNTKYLSCHEAFKHANASKNRFLDILPFDHSRVKLKPVEDDAASDYINANYIAGYSRPKEYIAAQGPLPNTGTDFWRMVWQENVSIIVMLTLCREKELNKCDNYWPLEKGSKLDFDDITVETTNVTHYHSYDYRNMLLQIDEYAHSLKHFHFLQWADFSANVPVEILVNFVQNVRSHISKNAPIVVHCSAGVGRTGTFIGVDYMLQFVDANPLDSQIDIYKFVSQMRDNRVHMVQNEKQYILVHNCIKYAVNKKITLETGEPTNEDDANLYENQGFVTIDITDEKKDVGSVQMTIEEEELEEDEEEEVEENPYENPMKGEPKNAEKDGLNDYENTYDIPKNVTIDLTEKELDEQHSQDLGSVQLLIEKQEDDEEENPYENEMQGVPKNAEKDYLNDYDSDENPYDIPENAVLINKNKEDKQLDESNKRLSKESKPVTFEGTEAEDENPYENQEYDDSDEKQMLTSL